MTRMAVYRIFYGVCNDSFCVNLKEDLTVLFFMCRNVYYYSPNGKLKVPPPEELSEPELPEVPAFISVE